MRIFPNKTQDQEFQTLRGEGFTGSLNDMQHAKLDSLGRSGALPDQMRFLRNNLWINSLSFSRASVGTYTDGGGAIRTAEDDVPRWDYSLVDGSFSGLTLEGEATRLNHYPVCADGVGWQAASATLTNLSLNVLGFYPGVRVASQGATWNRIRTANTIPLDAGKEYPFCRRYVAGTSGRIRLVFRDSVAATESKLLGPVGSIAVDTVTAGTFTNVSETLLSDGFTYEVRGVFTPNASSDYFPDDIGPDTSVVGEDVTAVSSFTYDDQNNLIQSDILHGEGGVATREPDEATLTDIDWASGGNGTLVVEFSTNLSDDFNRVIALTDGTSSERTEIHVEADGDIRMISVAGGVASVTSTIGTATAGQFHRVAFSFDTNDYRASVDGGAVVSDTVATVGTFTEMMLGQAPLAGSLNGHIRYFEGIPGTKTDSELQALSAI